MNLELFIAKRIHFSGKKGDKQVSSPAIKIAIAGVAIGLAAMIISVAIVIGFKNEVRSKVVGFGSHIRITNFDNNTSYEMHPIHIDDELREKLSSTKGVKRVEAFATKPAIIKTEDAFQGVILKGVEQNHDWNFFQQNMIEGNILNPSDSTLGNQAILSKNIADKLNLKVGDTFISYFVEEPIRARKFDIVGIYSTNFDDYDKLFVVTNIEIIQGLNKWNGNQVSGLELLVNDYNKLEDIKDEIFYEMMAYQDKDGNTLFAKSIKDLNPMIFNWLELLDMNVWVIIILMLAISGFTMISGLLIIILERTSLIGTLKTFGARNYSIRKTFLYVSSFLVMKGMIWGNLIALAVIILQKTFGIIKLDPTAYYVSEMPVDFNIFYILLINIGTLAISMLMMVGPSYLIAKISPVKSIRYE